MAVECSNIIVLGAFEPNYVLLKLSLSRPLGI
jgi:hypothetical protein